VTTVSEVFQVVCSKRAVQQQRKNSHQSPVVTRRVRSAA